MRVAILVALMSLFAAEASANCDPGEQVIRLGTAPRYDSPARVRGLASLARAINQELQGRACLQISGDDQLYSSALAITALQSGSIELALPSFAELGSVAKDYQVFDLPFAFREDRTVKRFLILSGDRLGEDLKQFNIRSLAVWQGHFEQIAAKRPIIKPEDLAGLKIAVGNNPIASEMIDELDGIEQPIPKDQLAVAVKEGRIDAQVTNWFDLSNDKTTQLHEGVTQTNHAYRGYVLLTSQTWWDGLTPSLKRPLTELIARVSKQTNFDAEQQQTNARRSIIRSGATVRGLTKHQRQVWQDRLKYIWDDFENRKLLEILRQADRFL